MSEHAGEGADETAVWREALRPHWDAHFSPAEREALERRKREAYAAAGTDEAGFAAAWSALFREADALREAGDATSARARDLLRRWREMVGRFRVTDPGLRDRAEAVLRDTLGEAGAAERLGHRMAVLAWVERIAREQDAPRPV